MARILKYKNEISREWMIWRKRLHSICFRELPQKKHKKPSAGFRDCSPVPFSKFYDTILHIIMSKINDAAHLGMALKTVWIVPRWSGRLERGGYVKGHDPEVSKAPTRRSCCHDMTSHLYMSLWLGQRSHGKAERSSYSVHTSDSTWL